MNKQADPPSNPPAPPKTFTVADLVASVNGIPLTGGAAFLVDAPAHLLGCACETCGALEVQP